MGCLVGARSVCLALFLRLWSFASKGVLVANMRNQQILSALRCEVEIVRDALRYCKTFTARRHRPHFLHGVARCCTDLAVFADTHTLEHACSKLSHAKQK